MWHLLAVHVEEKLLLGVKRRRKSEKRTDERWTSRTERDKQRERGQKCKSETSANVRLAPTPHWATRASDTAAVSQAVLLAEPALKI